MEQKRIGNTGMISSIYNYYTIHYFDELLQEKQTVMRERGDILISVPCWWDGSSERYNNN